MPVSTRVLYAKFRMDDEGDAVAYIISENKDRVLSWEKSDEGQAPRNRLSRSTRHEIASAFDQLTDEFISDITAIYEAIPFIMFMASAMRRQEINRRLYSWIKKNGTLLDAPGNFAVYQLPGRFIGELEKIVSRLLSLKIGIRAMPGMFLVGLVSSYDSFLSQLLRVIFTTVPELLSSTDRNISFKDLVSIGSLDQARDLIINKEIDSVMRDGHHDQIAWLERKLNMPLRKDLPAWPKFIEVCERRNLFAHSSGVVSEQYLSVCREHGTELGDIQLGHTLQVTPKYFRESVDVIFEIAMKLIQVVWRKLLPREVDQAAQRLNQVGYELIGRKRYKLASVMLDFGLNTMKKHGTDKTRRMMVVNYANSEKLSGNIDKAKSILQSEDWSAASMDFEISIAGVNDDLDRVLALMPVAVGSKILGKDDFREWPVFQTIREQPQFIAEFEKLFEESFFVDKEGPSSSTALPASTDSQGSSIADEEGPVAAKLEDTPFPSEIKLE